MQALVVFAAIIATAAAGGITGYSTGNYVQHAHAATPVGYAAAPVATPFGIAAAPAVAKAIAPVAQSTQFVNRAPAARVFAAAPVAYAAPVAKAFAAPIAAPVAAYAAGPVGYAAPAVAAPAFLG